MASNGDRPAGARIWTVESMISLIGPLAVFKRTVIRMPVRFADPSLRISPTTWKALLPSGHSELETTQTSWNFGPGHARVAVPAWVPIPVSAGASAAPRRNEIDRRTGLVSG